MTQNGTTEHDEWATLDHNGPQIPLDNGTRSVFVDENGLRDILTKLRNNEEWIADLAPKLGVSAQYLADVLAGRSGIGPKLLKGLGVIRIHRIYELEVIADE